MAYQYRISGVATIQLVKPRLLVKTKQSHGQFPQVSESAQKLETTNIFTAIMFAGSGVQGKTMCKITTFTYSSNVQVLSF